jgi:hypothetical protein
MQIANYTMDEECCVSCCPELLDDDEQQLEGELCSMRHYAWT